MFALFTHVVHLFFRIVYVVRLFSFFFFLGDYIQRILLTGKSYHKCRSGTRKKAKNIAKQMQTQSKLRCFCIVSCFCFACVHCFFEKQFLMVGHTWLPLLNTILLPVTVSKPLSCMLTILNKACNLTIIHWAGPNGRLDPTHGTHRVRTPGPYGT